MSESDAAGTGNSVNTEALAPHGGYGIYADTHCRDYLYGATLVSAEVGAIISNNGAMAAQDAATAVTQDGNSALAWYDGEISEDARTTIRRDSYPRKEAVQRVCNSSMYSFFFEEKASNIMSFYADV